MLIPRLALLPISLVFSSAAYMIAIQQAPHCRLRYAPIIFGCSIWSFHSSSRLTYGLEGPWGILNCYWMLHAASTLYLDPIIISPEVRSWKTAYKIWGDPQRRVDFTKPPPLPASRTLFTIRRCLKVIVSWAIHICIVAPMTNLDLTAEEIDPAREILLRRVLFPHMKPPFTRREIHVRCVWSIYGFWMTYLGFDLCHVLLSIFFVVVLRLDAPQEWPSFFGNPLQVYSVRRIWSRFWHRCTVPASAVSGRLITRRLLGMRPGSRLEKTCIPLWTFLITAIAHTITDRQSGAPCRAMGEFAFVLANFGAGAVESLVVPYAMDRCGDNRLRQILTSDLGKRVVGYTWVFAFLFWISPKAQYPKLRDLLESV